MNWLDRIGFPRLIFYYVLSLPVMVVGGAAVFFFPVLPIYDAAGWEFSNLGPIVTALGGFVLWLYVVTPLFIAAVVAKLFRRMSTRRGHPHHG